MSLMSFYCARKREIDAAVQLSPFAKEKKYCVDHDGGASGKQFYIFAFAEI